MYSQIRKSLSHILIPVIFCISPDPTRSCDLVEWSPGGGSPLSCMNLRATPGITAASSPFGKYIEGTATNPRGEMFAVNYGNASTLNTIGQFYPVLRPFYSDPLTNSKLHGMRFHNGTLAYVVDEINLRVLQLTVGQSEQGHPVVQGSSTFCTDPRMISPNDLTLARTGTVFTSGMTEGAANTGNEDGHIWSCTQNGEVKLLEVMGRTNGIDLSPDDRLLYVSESYTTDGRPVSQKIWVYDVDTEGGSISGRRLFADFATIDSSQAHDVDGMRTDVAGNLWVSRYGGGKVSILNSDGHLIGQVGLSFSNPTNLEFGGEDGTTLFVVGKCGHADEISIRVVSTVFMSLRRGGSGAICKCSNYSRIAKKLFKIL